MFTRTVNSNVLESEGLNAPTTQPPPRRLMWEKEMTDDKNGSDSSSDSSGSSGDDAAATAAAIAQSSRDKMRLWTYFTSPSHATQPRKVIDASTPPTTIDEAHLARVHGATSFLISMMSLAEIFGMREDVPYTNTHHNGELVRIWLLLANVWQANHFFSRSQIAGLVLTRMRYRYAYYIAAVMGQLRISIATLIAAGGYYYTLEYLYTYGPRRFRVRDPSPNGYRLGWREGQTCYKARMVASLWLPVAFAFYTRSLKRCGIVLYMSLGASVYYEYARIHVLPGMRIGLQQHAYMDAQREAGFGSLAPQWRRMIDPDTNRSELAAQHRYFTMMCSSMQSTLWERTISYEDTADWQRGPRIPNPYYNWTKARQLYDDAPIRYKNDLWQLPRVVTASARMSH